MMNPKPRLHVKMRDESEEDEAKVQAGRIVRSSGSPGKDLYDTSNFK